MKIQILISNKKTLLLNIDPKDSELDMNNFHSIDESIVSIKNIKSQQLIISSTDNEGSVTIQFVDEQKTLTTVQAQQ